LDVSRISAGTITLGLATVDLEQVVDLVLDRQREQIGRSKSVVTTEMEPAVGRWDPMRIDQIVTNLVANAVKYGRGNPVTIRVKAGTERAVLEVEDRGIG